MSAINGVQSTSFSFLRPQASSAGGVERSTAARNAGLAVDRYSASSETGQNGATAAGGQTACRCGNCPACAAQAYAQEGQRLKGEEKTGPGQPETGQEPEAAEGEGGRATAPGPKGVDGEVLSQQEQARLAELKKFDRAVRAHEQAHLAAAGNLVRRGVSLSYEKGPDGRSYAVGGEVSIDTSRESDPADTITKMRTVRAAALAPAEPSPQDRKVAAAAVVTMTNARHELTLARRAEENGENVVAQAADELAGRDGGETKTENDSPADAGGGQTTQLTPRRSLALQRYRQAAAPGPTG